LESPASVYGGLIDNPVEVNITYEGAGKIWLPIG